MTDYIELALCSDLSDGKYEEAGERLAYNVRLDHAIRGIGTEQAELSDALKKHVFYGKELDLVNLVEEAGDILWYVAILLDEIEKRTGVTALEVQRRNIAKLKARYPDGFSEAGALLRNLGVERAILEGEEQ